MGWVDTAKGACMVLVVLYHVTSLHYFGLAPTAEWMKAGWSAVNSYLSPVRMPLFFAISGLLASPSLVRPLKRALRARVFTQYYLYVLWVCIHACLFVFVIPKSFSGGFGDDSMKVMAARLVVPSGALWYLAALAIYFIIARFCLRLPSWFTLGGAALLSLVASAGLIPAGAKWVGLSSNLLFFLGGTYLPALYRQWTAERSRAKIVAVAALACFIVGLALRDLLGVGFLASLAAVPLGVTTFFLLPEEWRLSKSLQHLGRKTLPIYVMHVPLIGLLDWWVRLTADASLSESIAGAAVAVLYPAVVTVLVLVLCLVLERALRAIGLRSLFELPAGRRATMPVPEGSARAS